MPRPDLDESLLLELGVARGVLSQDVTWSSSEAGNWMHVETIYLSVVGL